MTKSILQRNLQSEMKAQGMTAKGLARLAGIKQDAVRDVLRGRSVDPRATTLLAIARALNVTVEALYAESATPEGSIPSTPLSVPIINTPIVRMWDLIKLSDGEAIVGSQTVPIAYNKKTIAALEMPDTALNRVIPRGALCIADYADRELVDSKIYVFELGGVIAVRRYRNTQGPERFEADSTDHYDTLYPSNENTVTVIARVVLTLTEL